MRDILAPDDGWHVPTPLRRAWAAGSVPDEQAWSVEAHLMACSTCRGDVAHDVPPGPLAALVDEVAARFEDLPPQEALRPASTRRRLLALLGLRQVGWVWGVALAAVLAGAAALDLVAGPWLVDGSGSAGAMAWFAAGGTWVGAVAPLLPVLGVALAYGPGLDPAQEIAAATPFGGLRLVLWRTAGVLVTAVPAALALQVLLALTRPGGLALPQLTGWLLPCLGLTVLTLAIGSLVGTTAAAVAVNTLWAAGTLVPLAAGASPVLLAGVPPALWLTAALAGAIVLALRRDRLGPLVIPPTFGGLA